MTDNDELLLKQFFSEAANRQIDDNGFTERVMQRIAAPKKPSVLTPQTISRLWTLLCIVLFAVLFVVFHGWELLAVHFEVMLRTMAVQPLSINLTMLFSVVFGLLFVGTGEVVLRER